MGKMLLFIIVGMGALFALANINISQSKMRMVNNAIEQYEKTQAKNIASSGINIAMMNIAKDSTWSGISSLGMAGGSGTLKIVVTNTQSLYPNGPAMGQNNKQIASIGNVNGQKDTVWAVVNIPTTESVPQFMTMGILSENSMTLNGGINIRDDNNASWNSNLHTNGTLTINGNNLVEGFGSYSVSYESNPAKRINSTFVPNVNPNGLPVHSKIPKVVIPDFNPDDYLGIADEITTGNLTISGSKTLGTKSEPKIWYVSGNLTLSGNITGYGCFIVKGSITLNGNVDITSVDPSGNNLGLYAKGPVTLNGNVTARAQILSSSNITMNGNCKLYGLATSKANFVMNGNINIYYRPSLSTMTAPFWTAGTPLHPRVVSYYD